MRLTNLTIAHAVVMLATLASMTLLGVLDKISSDALVALFSGIAGVVFGAAASQSAANGSTRAVVDAAIERGAEIEAASQARARGADRG